MENSRRTKIDILIDRAQQQQQNPNQKPADGDE